MSVEKMKMKMLFGKTEQLNTAITAITSLGFVHLENASAVMAGSKDFTPLNEENRASSVLSGLEEVLRSEGIQPDTVEPDPGDLTEEADRVFSQMRERVNDLQGVCNRLKNEIDRLQSELDLMKHFSGLHYPLEELRSTEYVSAHFGSIPMESYERLKQYRQSDGLQYSICSSDKTNCWLVYFSQKELDDADRIFASLFFSPIELPEKDGTPTQICNADAERIFDLHGEWITANQELQNFSHEHQGELISLYAHLKYQNDIFSFRKYACRYRDTYAALICWVPENRCTELESALKVADSFTVSDMSSGNDTQRFMPPTKLKNKKLFRPFQYFVEMYGAPAYHEVDPTVFVAITYTLLYGIMFADVGQGLLLAIAGYFMYRFMNNPVGKILIPCGICGSFFGLLFGSVFGNEELLDPLYHAIGLSGKPFSVMENANTLLALSVGIGVTLLLAAMGLSIYSSFKKGNRGLAFFGSNGIAGMILYLSLLCIILRVFDIVLPIPTVLLVVVGILVPVVCIFLHKPLNAVLKGQGFSLGESVSDFIIENLFELIEVFLSYFTNTLSFLRVGAFVLIHAGMMMAFEALAGIVGGGVVGGIMMVFGNIFVTVLEGLLVAIQVLRLEFYEMFSRFYDGDGRLFTPATALHAKISSKHIGKKSKENRSRKQDLLN